MDAKDLFEILVRENADMLSAYLRAAVSDTSTVDDLFQETMLTAWRRLPDYDKKRPFAPWLRGIAARVILAHYRKSTQAMQKCDEATLDYLSSRFQQIHQLPGDSFHEKLDALRDCIESLPPTYREPVELRYREELQSGEVAKRLGLAAEALKKRLTRAKARLWGCIERKLKLSETGL